MLAWRTGATGSDGVGDNDGAGFHKGHIVLHGDQPAHPDRARRDAVMVSQAVSMEWQSRCGVTAPSSKRSRGGSGNREEGRRTQVGELDDATAIRVVGRKGLLEVRQLLVRQLHHQHELTHRIKAQRHDGAASGLAASVRRWEGGTPARSYHGSQTG